MTELSRQLRHRHKPTPTGFGGTHQLCAVCGEHWPCFAIQAAWKLEVLEEGFEQR